MALVLQGTNGPPFREDAQVEEFANALDVCMSRESDQRQHILDLPRRFHESTLRKLEQLRPRTSRGGNDDVDMDADEAETTTTTSSSDRDEIRRLEKEAQTWDLLRRLLPLRYSSSASKSTPSNLAKFERIPNDMVQDFWQTEPLALERRAVLQWLQNTAGSGPDIDEMVQELQQSAGRGDIIAHGWLHTRSAIKLRKSVTSWPHLLDRQSSNISESHLNADGAPLVTQLDPDAVTRQGRKLEPQDDYFERAIWLGCFQHLRRGSSLEALRDWCQERTEMWRAISMSAIMLSVDDKETVADTDSTALALWRRMCFSLARQGGCDDYERAVYGVLSGDILSVEKVASTWDDYLFANYNALLRTQLDTFILGQCPPETASSLTQAFPAFDAVQFHGDADEADKRIVRSLESNQQIQEEATEPYKALQAAFIARDIERHLFEQGQVIDGRDLVQQPRRRLFSGEVEVLGSDTRKFFTTEQYAGLRVVAHTYVLIALLDRLDGKGKDRLRAPTQEQKHAQESILASYTDLLRRAQVTHLIPLYCSILDTPRRYEVLSENVLQELDEEQRILQLKLITKTGIDVVEFVRHQATRVYLDLVPRPGHTAQAAFNIFAEEPPSPRYGRLIKPDFFGPDESAIAPEHERLIASVEWLLMAEKTWPEAFTAGANAYKFFLRNMHLTAARGLMERVGFDAIASHMNITEDFEEDNLYNIRFWTEQLSDAEHADVDPSDIMRDARILRQLETLVKALDRLETIASMVGMSAELSPTDKSKEIRTFWSELGFTLSSTKDLMETLFRNWLIADIEEGDKELADLRVAFLPETILAYVSALHFAGARLSRDNLLECMELASVVAERNSDLAQCFMDAGRMKELVEAFAAVSKALAVSTGDKKTTSSSNKKLREMGWSRDIWAVKP